MTRTRSWYPTPRPRRGYTVMELMIVATVLSVVTVMSAGKISDYVRDRNVAAASSIFRSDLQQAFAIAARNRRPVRITFSTADTALRITDRENTVTYVRRGFGNGSGLMLRPSDVSFCSNTCTNASIDVYPNGWASDTLNVALGKGSHLRTLRMSRSGLVSTK